MILYRKTKDNNRKAESPHAQPGAIHRTLRAGTDHYMRRLADPVERQIPG